MSTNDWNGRPPRPAFADQAGGMKLLRGIETE